MPVGVVVFRIHREIFISEPGEVFHFGEYQVGYTGLTTRYVDRYGEHNAQPRSERTSGRVCFREDLWENRTQPPTKVGVFSTIKKIVP